uniref:Transposase n=1 Tax=Ascaris lumbricoides TaxID=6252 RepID=A0A0M3IIP9_ASCLU
MHRLSADERDIRRYARRTSQTRLNSDRESANCTRRASRAADMFSETGDFGITLAEQLQLSRFVLNSCISS